MNEPQFKVGDHVRDKSDIGDADGRALEGRVETVSISGGLTIIARDGRQYGYGGPYILRSLSNLERITRALHLR
jgi:hypothetical protein